MSKLTSSQALDLAEDFIEAAEQLRQFRLAKKNVLKPKENERLRATTLSLTMISQLIGTESVGLMLDEATITISGLQSATQRAQKAIRKIKDAKKGIEVAAALISLGAAIVSKDPNGVFSSAQSLVKAISSFGARSKKKTKKKTKKKMN